MVLTQARFYSIVQFYCFQDFTVFSFIVTKAVSSIYIYLLGIIDDFNCIFSEKYD